MKHDNNISRKTLVALSMSGTLALGAIPVGAQQYQNNQSNRSAQQSSAAMQSLITAESVLDSNVYDNNNSKIGEVENLFVNPQTGRIERVGIQFETDATDRDREYSVTWDQFRVMRRDGGELALIMDPAVVQRVRQAGDIGSAQLSTQQIRQVQQQLNAKGFSAGDVNGQWNQETQRAVRSFQQMQGLQATGQLNEQTLNQLGLDADAFRQTREPGRSW